MGYARELGRVMGTPEKEVCWQSGASGEPRWNRVWIEVPPWQDRAVFF